MAMYFKSKEWRKSLTCQKKKILQNWDNWKVVLDRKRRVLIATGLLSPDVSTKDFKVQIRLSYQAIYLLTFTEIYRCACTIQYSRSGVTICICRIQLCCGLYDGCFIMKFGKRQKSGLVVALSTIESSKCLK